MALAHMTQYTLQNDFWNKEHTASSRPLTHFSAVSQPNCNWHADPHITS